MPPNLIDHLRASSMPDRHRVDREVAAAQVVLEGARADVRKRSGTRVGLGSGGGDVNRIPVDQQVDGAETVVDLRRGSNPAASGTGSLR